MCSGATCCTEMDVEELVAVLLLGGGKEGWAGMQSWAVERDRDAQESIHS